jgi:hypothetical protein
MALTKPPTATDDDQAELEYLASYLIMLSRGFRDGDAANATRAAGATPTSANMADSYRCSLCNKVFASYQALGGHKTSHRKPPTAAAPSDEASSSGTTHEKEEKLHQCSLCPPHVLIGAGTGRPRTWFTVLE